MYSVLTHSGDESRMGSAEPVVGKRSEFCSIIYISGNHLADSFLVILSVQNIIIKPFPQSIQNISYVALLLSPISLLKMMDIVGYFLKSCFNKTSRKICITCIQIDNSKTLLQAILLEETES